MSALVLLPSRVNPGTLSGEFLISSGVLLTPSLVTPGSLAESCQPCKSCRVVSLLELLPSHVTPCALVSRVIPGALADEFTSPRGAFLSPSRVTPGSLAQSCHSWSFCAVVALLELLPANF